MKFTEEQIKAILECVGNTSIELFRSEWEELEESLRKGLTKALFSVIPNVSKERRINQWNVLIVIESAEHTLNVLNAERGNKNGNGILNCWRNF